MAAELKVIFEGLDNIKKKIEAGISNASVRVQDIKPVQKNKDSINKLNTTINKLQLKLSKNNVLENKFMKQFFNNEKLMKQLNSTFDKNKSVMNDLTSKINKLKGSINFGADEAKKNLIKNISMNETALTALESKLEGLVSKKGNIESKPEFINAKTEKLLDKINIQIARTSNNILSMKNDIGKKILDLEQNDDVIKVNQSIEKQISSLQNKISGFTDKNLTILNKLDKHELTNDSILQSVDSNVKLSNDIMTDINSNNEKIAGHIKQITPNLSNFDKIMINVFDKLGMTKTSDKLITKRTEAYQQSPGSAKSAKGGSAGAAMLAGAAGGAVVGLLMQLVKSTKAVSFFMEFVGGILNSLIGPFLPILIGLMKPFFLIMMFLAGFMIKFFMDPFEALKDLGKEIATQIKNLVGYGGTDKQKTATSGVGAIAGGVIGGIAGGGIGALIGAFLGPMLMDWGVKFFAMLFGFSAFLGEKTYDAVMIVWNYIKDSFSSVKNWGSDMWTIIKDSFSVLGDNFIAIGNWFGGIWDSVKSSFSTAWELLSGFGNWIWTNIKDSLSSAWDLLKTFGTWIYDQLKDVGKTFGNGIINAVNKITEYINEALDWIPGVGGSTIPNIPSISDGVISPAGKIVSVDPKDYLLASKNPRDLMSGSGNSGNNVTINLTVNGNADKTMINDIVKKLRTAMSSKGAF